MAKRTERPRVEVMERSEQVALEEIIRQRERNPFGVPSAPIRFHDAELVGHWFNSAKSPDSIYAAKLNGWRGVTPDMVADPDQIGHYAESPDGFISRGERGQELLMCMPATLVSRIALAKTRENIKRMGGSNVKNDVIQALGKTDAQGAEFLEKHTSLGGGPIGTVRDSYERIAVDPQE